MSYSFYFFINYFLIVVNRRGETIEDTAFLNEKNPALQDVVRRLPSILTDYKIRSADLVVNQTHVKVILNQYSIMI